MFTCILGLYCDWLTLANCDNVNRLCYCFFPKNSFINHGWKWYRSHTGTEFWWWVWRCYRWWRQWQAGMYFISIALSKNDCAWFIFICYFINSSQLFLSFKCHLLYITQTFLFSRHLRNLSKWLIWCMQVYYVNSIVSWQNHNFIKHALGVFVELSNYSNLHCRLPILVCLCRKVFKEKNFPWLKVNSVMISHLFYLDLFFLTKADFLESKHENMIFVCE